MDLKQCFSGNLFQYDHVLYICLCVYVRVFVEILNYETVLYGIKESDR